MNARSVVDLFLSHSLDLNKPREVLKILDLLNNFTKAKDENERRQVVKTVLRTVLPFPASMAAGEILIRLRKLIKSLDKLIKDGIKV